MAEKAKPEIAYKNFFKWAFFVFLFLLSFGLAEDSFHAYASLVAVLLGALYIIMGEAKVEKSLLKSYLIYLIPAAVLIILVSLSNFWFNIYGSIGNFLLYGVINLLGGCAMVLFGLQLRKDDVISFKEISYAVFGGLALVTLVSLIASLAAYGPFYPILQSGKKYIYDSVDYSISSESIWLICFSLKEVDIRYTSVFANILAVSLLLLLWVKVKEDKLSFFVYLGTGLVGLAHLILITSKWALICFAVVAVMAILLRFIKFPKKTPLWEKIVAICGVSVIAIILILMFVVAIIGNNIYGEGILGRIFDNGVTGAINHVINMTFKERYAFSFLEALFGANPNTYSYWGSALSASIADINLRTVEFYALLEGGIFAFLGFCFMIVFGVIGLRRYLHEEENMTIAPIAITLILSAYILTMSISSSVPFPYTRTNRIYYSPFSDSSIFYLVLFFYGYSATHIGFRKKEVAA